MGKTVFDLNNRKQNNWWSICSFLALKKISTLPIFWNWAPNNTYTCPAETCRFSEIAKSAKSLHPTAHGFSSAQTMFFVTSFVSLFLFKENYTFENEWFQCFHFKSLFWIRNKHISYKANKKNNPPNFISFSLTKGKTTCISIPVIQNFAVYSVHISKP